MTGREALKAIDFMFGISARTGINPDPIYKVPLPKKPIPKKELWELPVYSFEIDVIVEKDN